jgi:DNA-binding response OmpR family regulator
MRLLVVDDDRALRDVLRRSLTLAGYDVRVTETGAGALSDVSSTVPDAVVLDIGLPDIDGLEVCRLLRREGNRVPILMLTARDAVADRIDGLDAGADDYLVKPFDPDELRARIHVGVRVLTLQERLADRVAELETAVSTVKRLQGLIPICSYCKRIRSEGNDWEQLESYISEHSNAQFSHGICPPCLEAALREAGSFTKS